MSRSAGAKLRRSGMAGPTFAARRVQAGMERSEILTTMSTLKLYGMKVAYDAERYGSTAFSLATAVKRQHEPERVVGDLLTAEISEKQARSIKYQMTIAKMPLAPKPYLGTSTTSCSRARRSTKP